MCGICGVVGGDPGRERDAVLRMSASLEHRGPDNHGLEVIDEAVFGNRRLAIIDPDATGQPLSNEDGRYWITFNGEIYNHRELRGGLEARGHRFRTRTDTEVLLHLFEEDGWEALAQLRGMFAFAIWDRRERRLHAARDHFGQKPFHYALSKGRFLFGSEIKAILAHPDVRAEPELEAVDHYLTQRFVPPPLTMFRGIHRLPAGHRLEWSGGEVTVERWWSPDFRASESRPDAEWIDGLESMVDRAVVRHMESDVPIGALLSGGLDSSAVVSAMARAAGPDFPTFCVGTEVASLDERGFAREVADHVGTQHLDRRVGDEVLGSIPTLVRCLDEPSDPIAACTWEAARLAGEHVKVVLGGDGGDEIFGGFDRYAAFPLAQRYSALPAWFRERVVAPAVNGLPGALSYKSVGQKARWLNDLGGRRGGALYARMTSVFRFGPEEKAWVYGPALREAVTGASEACIADAFENAPARDPLHRMLYADLVTRLPEHSLMLADRLSMAHGLELRSPLLDVDLANFTAPMPARLKVRGTATKVALRAAFRDRLPASILRRPKQGFMLPVSHWLQGSSLDRVRDTIEGGPLVIEGWIAPGAASRLVDEQAGREADHHVRLWMLLNLDAWCRIHLGLGGDTEWPDELAPSGMEGASIIRTR
jgi:asparagine synthase (glutamine-hydrolysing)